MNGRRGAKYFPQGPERQGRSYPHCEIDHVMRLSSVVVQLPCDNDNSVAVRTCLSKEAVRILQIYTQKCHRTKTCMRSSRYGSLVRPNPVHSNFYFIASVLLQDAVRPSLASPKSVKRV